MQFSGNSALFLGSFIAYIALMILIGWFASRKVSKGGTAFLTGGGHLPVFLTVCTAAATLIGTGGTMGRTGQAFSGGLACFGYVIVGPVTLLILAFVFTPMRSKNFITMGQEIQYYYGGDINVRRVAGVLTFLTEMCYIASHRPVVQSIFNLSPDMTLFCARSFVCSASQFMCGWVAILQLFGLMQYSSVLFLLAFSVSSPRSVP